MTRFLREVFSPALEFVRNFGAMTLFFVQLLRYTPWTLVRRFGLVVGQVYNAGALSIVIIMVCGLFVGGVLGLQAFANLERFNAEEATGILAAFALVKEIGPMQRVLVPRFLGGIIAMPLLTAVFTMVGLLGAHLVAVELLGVDVGAFWQQLQQAMDIEDVNEGIIKSVVFGVVASLLAVWEGYSAVPTAEGVGRATTRTVVATAIAVLILDFMITAYLI